MDRDEFMDIVYSELESDSDNNRANRIIDAADEYVESTHFCTKLAEVGTDCISRRQAIDAVTNELDMIDHVPQWVFDRLEKRLKQLPNVQPEPCDDAVSREEVLNCLEWQYPDKTPRTKIMELPPVTPKQRTGKWIKKHRHYGGFRSYTGFDAMGEQHTVTVDERTEYDDLYCSECGARSADNFLNFCPNCGVKMEGDAE